MSFSEVIVEGTLKPDGTLELDQKPSLSPGRVKVVLRPATEEALPQENLLQFMQRTRQELEAAGCHFMNEEEMNAHIEWLREGDRIDDLLREADEHRKQE